MERTREDLVTTTRRIRKPTLARLLVLILFVGAAGCGQGPAPVPNAPAAVAAAAASLLSGSGVTSPAGSLPGSITSPGASGNLPPLAALPSPTDARDQIQRLCQRFGINSITGSGATPELLRQLEVAYASYPAGSCRNLDLVFEPTEKGDLGGVWSPLDAAGNESQPGTEPVKAKITYYAPDPSDIWLLRHELAHHLTLLVDSGFGRRTVETLGYTETTGQPTNLTYVNWGEFQASAVVRDGFPTEYSHTHAVEHVAEAITCHLNGGRSRDGMEDPNFVRIPPAVAAVLTARLGGAPGQS